MNTNIIEDRAGGLVHDGSLQESGPLPCASGKDAIKAPVPWAESPTFKLFGPAGDSCPFKNNLVAGAALRRIPDTAGQVIHSFGHGSQQLGEDAADPTAFQFLTSMSTAAVPT